MVKPQREFCLVVQRVTLALSGWSASQRCIFLIIIAFVFLYSDQGCDVWSEWWTKCNLFALVRTRSGTNAEGERPASGDRRASSETNAEAACGIPTRVSRCLGYTPRRVVD